MSERDFGPRAHIAAISQTHHGALNYAELAGKGIVPEDVLDFSSNINPFGPPDAVTALGLDEIELAGYPDRDSHVLRGAFADHLQIDPQRIFVGNGTAELIWLLAFTCLQPGDKVVQLAPTFGEYARCAALMGADVISLWAAEANGFQHDVQAVTDALEEHQPRLVFVCNPNNPTGTILPAEQIAAWAAQFPQTGFVVDEAYQPFAETPDSLVGAEQSNLIVLRSLTKDYTLAGLRLGFVVAAPAVLDALQKARPAWNVNAVAQAAGVAALQAEEFLPSSVEKIREAKGRFIPTLESLGYRPLPSCTHFFVMPVGEGHAFRARLLSEHHIQVRDCASFGMPAYVRIAVRRPEENERLLAALRQM